MAERGLFERDGAWWISYADATGKMRREKAGTKFAARSLYTKRKEEARLQKLFPENYEKPAEYTVSQLIFRYQPEILARKRNKKSANESNREARLWATDLGTRVASSLRPGDIEQWKAQRARSYRPATVNRSLAYLKHLLNLAVRDDLLAKNPLAAGRVKMLAEDNTRIRVFTPEEEADLMKALPERVANAFAFAIQTGLRRAEQFNGLRQHYSHETGFLYLPETKKGRGEHVRLNSRARQLIEAALASHDGPYIWPGHREARLSPDSVQHLLQRRAAALKLAPGVTWHITRHTFVSRLVMLGVPLPVVKELARHSTIQMTMRYAHFAPRDQHEAIERLAEFTSTKTSTALE